MKKFQVMIIDRPDGSVDKRADCGIEANNMHHALSIVDQTKDLSTVVQLRITFIPLEEGD